MTRELVLEWLNYRLELCNQRNPLYFADRDVDFIGLYILHYKSKTVPVQDIIDSLQMNINNAYKLGHHIDSMINKMLIDFNIKTEVDIMPRKEIIMELGGIREVISNRVLKYF